MGGDVETIKERLDIVEVVAPYLKLEKAGQNFKACCPFHNEKTPSFFISSSRQNFYCFGCGEKGDIFTFIEHVEGLDFREALKFLADKAGVELTSNQNNKEARTEKDKMLHILETATDYFEQELKEEEQVDKYLESRGINEESVKRWRIGYAKDEWRNLYTYLTHNKFDRSLILNTGLAKIAEGKELKEPYDVFRGRIIFPLFDPSGHVVAFSGRLFGKDSKDAPKYLNSPETVLFLKSELLYGLDKAKEEIRRKNYAVLVEGQIDLVLSHQAGIKNTVASSGTAFTSAHLGKLKKLSNRIVLAFDGDEAGEKAAEKSTILGLSLGMEVKVASLPHGSDPAELIKEDENKWKNVLRESLPAIEFFLNKVVNGEGDSRKRGKLIEKKILPLILLLSSSIEKSHYVSLISKRTGIKEEAIWDDLRVAKIPDASQMTNVKGQMTKGDEKETKEVMVKSRKEAMQERLEIVSTWVKELKKGEDEYEKVVKEETELKDNIAEEAMREKLSLLIVELAKAEAEKDSKLSTRLSKEISAVHKEMMNLEAKRKNDVT